MPVYYSLISRGRVVVCDYSSSGVSLEAVSLEALENLGPSDIKRCQPAASGDFLVFTLVDDSLTYLCVTDSEFNRDNAFAYLNDVKQELRIHGLHSKAKSNFCGPYSLRLEFGGILEQLTSQACGDKVAFLQSRVGVVKNAMKENINKVAERGESLSDLEGRSELLVHNSTDFRRTSVSLRKKMMWKSVKLWVILIVIICVVVLSIAIVVVVGLLATKKIAT